MIINLKNAVIKGTLILTAASILSRVIGFFYRIFLTRYIGSEGMGLFQLVTPVIGIVFAICSAGIQNGISKYSASKKENSTWLFSGLLISVPLATLISFVIYTNSEYIATRFLLNKNCCELLKMLSLSLPFASFHNCINGFYFSHKKTAVPAASQLLEQIVRVFTVFAYASYCKSINQQITVICALYGNLAGEISSSVFCAMMLIIGKKVNFSTKEILPCSKTLIKFSIPLTVNRLLMHLLQSGESILIPAQLILYGHSNSEALSIYGILNGMALPLIMFPTAITNSLAVMLLPEVSAAQAKDNKNAIINTLNKTITLCTVMGFLSSIFFLLIGGKIGSFLFNEPNVHTFILILAWLCPFLYLSTTLGSILNGLGETTATCFHSIFCVMLRIAFLVILVPKQGISGYLIGLLISQIALCVMHYIKLSRMFHIRRNPCGIISDCTSRLFFSLINSSNINRRS